MNIATENCKSTTNNIDLIKSSDINILFMGDVGVGKTTLINKLSCKDFEMEDFLGEKINIPFIGSLKKEDFICIEFPPFNSDIKNRLKNYEIQRNILSSIPVKMICFVIKYSIHFDIMIEKIKFMSNIFEEYKNNILIIITHSEAIINNIQFQSNIIKIIKNTFEYKYIIFSNLNISNIILQRKIKQYMELMRNISHLNIKTRNLINTIGADISDSKYLDIRNKFKNEFLKTLDIFKENIVKNKDNGDIIRGLFFTLKVFKNKHIKKYNKELIERMNDNNIYSILTEVIMYNNSIYNKFREFCN